MEAARRLRDGGQKVELRITYPVAVEGDAFRRNQDMAKRDGSAK